MRGENLSSNGEGSVGGCGERLGVRRLLTTAVTPPPPPVG